MIRLDYLELAMLDYALDGMVDARLCEELKLTRAALTQKQKEIQNKLQRRYFQSCVNLYKLWISEEE